MDAPPAFASAIATSMAPRATPPGSSAGRTCNTRSAPPAPRRDLVSAGPARVVKSVAAPVIGAPEPLIPTSIPFRRTWSSRAS